MISGRTRLVAHLGVPTESFTAPMICNPYFEAGGIEAAVIPMGCEAADFPIFLPLLFRLRNIAGALITMPHKVTAARLADRLDQAAAICGACNAVRPEEDGSLTGAMFDGEGFLRGLRRKGRDPAGASALIVGAGGAGSAIAASLAAAGCARLALHDTSDAALQALAGRLTTHYPKLALEVGAADPADTDIAVNATPLGMRPGDPLPFDVARLSPHALVGDVVLKPVETPLIAAARALGCEVQIGSDMLFEQIPACLDFFGLPATTSETLRRLARLTP